MKKFVLATALVGFAAAANAGSPEPVRVEPEVVEAEANGSSSGIVFPLFVIAMLAVAAN